MITVDGVSTSYGGTTVLGPVSLRFPDHGITSLIGSNGAGKSTLLTTVGRLLVPDTGSVVIDGPGGPLDVHAARSREVATALAVLRQENHFDLRLTVRELVSFGRFPHSRGRPGAEDERLVDQALDLLDLLDLQQRPIDQLSGGQRQRAHVAMVLAQDTRYVLLDEPLNNLDMKHAVRMMRRLRRAADDLGKSVVMVVHDVNFAARWSDHLIALRDGEVVAQGTTREMMRPQVLEAVFDTPVDVHEIDGRPVAVYFG